MLPLRQHLFPKATIKVGKVISTSIHWILWSIVLYWFFMYLEQMIQFYSTSKVFYAHDSYSLSTLSITLSFWDRLFLAQIASIIGMQFVLPQLLLQKERQHQSAYRRKFRYMRAMHHFQAWMTLFVLGITAIMFGLLYIMFPYYFGITIMEDSPALRWLVPSVLFLAGWPGIQRLHGKQVWRWVGLAFLAVVVLSLLLAF